MAYMKTTGKAILGLAIIIGIVGKFSPSLFMNLPFPLSAILWTATGHSMPPYVNADAWAEDEIDSWTKDGDLVVATGAKSGTTFMLYCTHQIRTRGTDLDDTLFPDVGISTPWPDLMQSRSATWTKQKELLNTTILPDGRNLRDIWDHPSYPLRIWKSHWFPPVMPVRRKDGRKGKKIKYLAMVRNGIDMAASMAAFFDSFTDEFRYLWGGFPHQVANERYDGDEPPATVKALLPGGAMEAMYFTYVTAWWPYRDDPNVMLMHYSDVRKDLRGWVTKVAKFMEVDLTGQEVDVVTERCSLGHMKKVNKFKYKQPLNTDSFWNVAEHQIVRDGKMTNKGGVGTGAAIFSDKVVAQWKNAEEEQFGHDPALLKWAREGGDFPPVQ